MKLFLFVQKPILPLSKVLSRIPPQTPFVFSELGFFSRDVSPGEKAERGAVSPIQRKGEKEGGGGGKKREGGRTGSAEIVCTSLPASREKRWEKSSEKGGEGEKTLSFSLDFCLGSCGT